MSTNYTFEPFESISSEPSDGGEIESIGRTPLQWLGAALLVAALGAALSLVMSGVGLILGWALCGPVAFGVIAFFVNRDMRQRTKAVYVRSSFYTALYWGTIVLTFVAVLMSAVRLAYWVARL